jgi:MEMO1 family protein
LIHFQAGVNSGAILYPHMWVAGEVEATVEKASQRAKIRPPAAAGLFYAGDPHQLQATVSELLGEAQPSTKVLPKALIAPHAGYVYSGRVAAEAFATLRAGAQWIARVVLIGPAHFVAVRGIAAPTVDGFETPLGCVPVDRHALSAIGDLPFVIATDAPHAPEHSLEVELPFLQALLPNFAVVPLVIGDAAPQHVAEVLRRLWGGPETLIVVSSDLSHYHDYDTARRLDAATAAAIERGDWESLGPNQACGYLAVAGLLVEAGRRRLTPQRLSLCNSGDTAGSRDRVVGYGAWAVEQTGAAA